MIKCTIRRLGNSRDAFGNATTAVVSPIEDLDLEAEAVIPWLLRGKAGNLDAGVQVIVDRFIDGTSMIFSRADGDFGGVIYGQTLLLGDDSGTDFVALAQKVKDALTDIQSKFNSHTHKVSTTGTAAAQSGTAAPVIPAGQLWPVSVPGVAAEQVKAK